MDDLIDPRIKSDRYTHDEIVSVYRGLFNNTGYVEQSISMYGPLQPVNDRVLATLLTHAEKILDKRKRD